MHARALSLDEGFDPAVARRTELDELTPPPPWPRPQDVHPRRVAPPGLGPVVTDLVERGSVRITMGDEDETAAQIVERAPLLGRDRERMVGATRPSDARWVDG